MTIRSLAVALLGSTLLLGACQSTGPSGTREIPVDFAFAGVSSVLVPAGYTLGHDGETTYSNQTTVYPGLAPVVYEAGLVLTRRSVGSTREIFNYAVYSCIEGCEQIADEGVWEQVEVAYSADRIASNDFFISGTETHREHAEGDSWCATSSGIRRSDGRDLSITYCAEQYTAPDGSLNLRRFMASDERLVPDAVNALFSSLPP